MRRAVVLALVLAACDPPSPTLKLAYDSTAVGLCPSTNCAEVPMTCSTYVSIRIIDPSDPTAPYLSQCEEIPLRDTNPNICTVASVELDQKALPLQTLEVEVALFPAADITFDPMTHDPICPTDTKFDVSTGFPIASDVTPAVGGRGFYHPGDEQVLVTMACTDLGSINAASCGGNTGNIPVFAQVIDFNSGVTFTGSLNTVAVGEPVVSDTTFELPPLLYHPLDPPSATLASWVGRLEKPFSSYACLVVLDDAPQSTTSVVCRLAKPTDVEERWPKSPDPTKGEVDDATMVSAGVRISKGTLDQLLHALSMTSFPDSGLTVGIVLDSVGNPVSNQTITVPPGTGTIQYLLEDTSAFSGTKTSKNGIWVSTDARFGTVFSSTNGTKTVARLGGSIAGKLTIVVLQFRSGGV